MKFLGTMLVILVFIRTTEGLDRCLFTHKDKPCVATGQLPISLECRYPGRWFKVEKSEHLSTIGKWEKLNHTESAADLQCKKTKSKVSTTSRDYKCEVHDLGVKPESKVRITYFCWEMDTDLLAGFGKK